MHIIDYVASVNFPSLHIASPPHTLSPPLQIFTPHTPTPFLIHLSFAPLYMYMYMHIVNANIRYISIYSYHHPSLHVSLTAHCHPIVRIWGWRLWGGKGACVCGCVREAKFEMYIYTYDLSVFLELHVCTCIIMKVHKVHLS